MDNERNSLLRAAVTTLLRPLVRILIRYGLSYSEFSELAKHTYIDVADHDFAIKSRKQSVSRVAILTGLSRKEVQKLRCKQETTQHPVAAPINRANRVIMGWLKDADYIDQNYKPRIIPLRGLRGSFESLVKKYSGDITARAILDELVRIGAIERQLDDSVKLLTEGYIPHGAKEKIEVMAKCVRDQLNTIDFNIAHAPYQTRFQRQVSYVDLPEKTLLEFQEYSKERAIEFIANLNLWLSQKKDALGDNVSSDKNGRQSRVGFGLYYFNDEKPMEES